MRTLIERLCVPFHYTWWVPVWNRSYLLSCPVGWLSRHSPIFRRWFWDIDD